MRIIFILIIFLFIQVRGMGQDSTYQQTRLVRLGSQNDLFQCSNKSDRNYSAGFFYELMHPIFNNVVTRAILLPIKKAPVQDFGFRISHQGFTPDDLTQSEVIEDDRPYAGLLYGTFYRISSDYVRGLRLETELKIGVLGPAAGMEAVQTWIHDVTDGTEPQGWDNQIGNALMLDYAVTVSKRIPVGLSFLDIHGVGNAEVGTVFNWMNAGFDFRLGLFNDPLFNANGFYNRHQKTYDGLPVPKGKNGVFRTDRKFQAYIYWEPRASLFLYDGTSSGGLIAFQDSPHTLSPSEIQQWIMFMNYGIVLQYGPFAFRYERVIRSERYYAGDLFSWGQFDIAILF